MTTLSEAKSKRPLSPHLQVYRLPYNAKMSISGRGVGIGLAGLVSLLLMWFVAIVWYPPFYDFTMDLIDTPYTQYPCLLLAFVVFFYLGNGIRHVLWDFGIGVNVKSGILTGNIVLVLSFLLTAGLWFIGSDHRGGQGAGVEASASLNAQGAKESE